MSLGINPDQIFKWSLVLVMLHMVASPIQWPESKWSPLWKKILSEPDLEKLISNAESPLLHVLAIVFIMLPVKGHSGKDKSAAIPEIGRWKLSQQWTDSRPEDTRSGPFIKVFVVLLTEYEQENLLESEFYVMQRSQGQLGSAEVCWLFTSPDLVNIK